MNLSRVRVLFITINLKGNQFECKYLKNCEFKTNIYTYRYSGFKNNGNRH